MHIDWGKMLGDIKQSSLWLVMLSLGILYASTYSLLAEGPWQTDQDGHGPFIVLLAIGIALNKASSIENVNGPKAPVLGWSLIILGLFAYVLGHSQEILLFDVGSLIPILIGITLILKGHEGLKHFWIPILFLSFAVPLPGWLMDSLTQPMKLYLSDLVVNQLFDLGFPVAQNGVIIYIAQYQLLVKDACMGLNSIYSLSVVGAFYIYLANPQSKFRIWALIACIIPFAFAANVVRVTFLVLITYYFGEEMGQGLLHDFTGLVMFCSALLLFIMFDTLLFRAPGWFVAMRRRS